MNRLTRRELAAVVSTSAALLASPQNPAPANADANDELTAARNEQRTRTAQLDKFPLPIFAEPATTFKP